MSFDVDAEAYDRFMGRYSILLSTQLADLAGIQGGQRALDVGCGPGALTTELAARLGSDAVVAVDPSESFSSRPALEIQVSTCGVRPRATCRFRMPCSTPFSRSSWSISCRIRWPG